MNLALNLSRSVEEFGERTAVKLDDVELSYAELGGASAHIVGMLREQGVEPGDRVGIMLPNVPYFPVIYYGTLRAGAVVVPMNPLLKAREVKFYLEDSGAKVLFAWHGFEEEAAKGAEEAGAQCILVTPGEFERQAGAAEALDEWNERDESDTAVILYTSGTTGTPKGAELTHANLGRNAVAGSRELIGLGEDDVLLGALPLFHSFGQTCSMNGAVAAGACLSLIPRFEPDKALEILERDAITVFGGVPTMYSAMLASSKKDDVDTSALRLCISGGSAMPGEVMRRFEEQFACKILEGYGLSETSPVASFNHPDRERKVGSIGTPIEGVEMKVVDDEDNEVDQGEVGEIVIRGHNVMKGYWQRDDATEEAMRGGWFHSGDMAQVDEEGYFFIVDRKKDLIIRGGYNVYPREIEEVIYEHPAVEEAAVIGVPHDELGEEVAAAIVLREGESATEEELREHVKENVAAYKYPRQVHLMDELPKGPTGKILKREIELPERAKANRPPRDSGSMLVGRVESAARWRRRMGENAPSPLKRAKRSADPPQWRH
ncbi:MAG: long-chain fatty acid--CoA ligase [Solirubrobacterales bacterium]|nr:long-chain fatty acid--CoA ligase [Solirubrobacterales bacterium]